MSTETSDSYLPHNMEPEKPESSAKTPMESHSSVIHIHSDTSAFNARIILTETNYDTWSQILEMHIAGREKLDYILGDSPQPQPNEPSYMKWYTENQKVKSWLLTSMAPEIMKRYLRLRTAREIWSALAKAFYDGADEAQIFALNQRAFSLRQSGRSLPSYYGELVEIFQELDYRDKVRMKHPEDIIMYKASVEKLRIHIFLNGLDDEFEQVRGEILRMDPSLDLERTYAYVRREANRKHLVAGDNSATESAIESMAMVIQGNKRTSRPTVPAPANLSSPQTPQSFDIDHKSSSSPRHCTHCGGIGHTQSRCYDLIGYPAWWDHSKAPKRRATATAAISSTHTIEPVHPEVAALRISSDPTTHHDEEADWLWH